jgi:S-adenosylmethionine decarboxylase
MRDRDDIHLWPYEQRFELLTNGDLLSLPRAVWHTVAKEAGAVVLKEGHSPLFRHFILSMSSLFVFRNRLVLLSCSHAGILGAARTVLQLADGLDPRSATLERRLPLGSLPPASSNYPKMSEDYPPVVSEAPGAVVHRWPLPNDIEVPSTFVLLMHETSGFCDLGALQTLVNDYFPDLLFVGHQFDATGFSFNAVGGLEYITMHYSGGVYASVESSLTNWNPFNLFLERVLRLCAPAVVAPFWYGEAIEPVVEGRVPRHSLESR